MKKLKVKCRPEDFLVDEIATLPLRPQGPYAVYRLVKEGWNTVDALRRITAALGLPDAAAAYGGKKDRYGLTTQWITLADPGRRTLTEKHYRLEYLGRAAEPMGPSHIAGNRFAVMVRDLDDDQIRRAQAQLDAVRADGLPNYFDDQRFGSHDPDHGFLAERLLKRQYSGALKSYLASIHPEDKKPEKDRKRLFAEHWKDWPACRAAAATRFEREAFEHLTRRPTDFVPLLQRLPREDLSMAIAAYQAHFWNELARRLLRGSGLPLRAWPGAAGEYLFFSRLTPETRSWAALDLPTLDGRFRPPTREAAALAEALLAEWEIPRHLFNHLKVRQAFFKSFDRALLVRPAELTARAEGDELYPGRRALGLTFVLPRGSYATLVVKRLFVE